MIYIVGCQMAQIYQWAFERHLGAAEVTYPKSRFRSLPLTRPEAFRGWRFQDGDTLIYLEGYEHYEHYSRSYEDLRLLEENARYELIRLYRKYHHTIPRSPADWDIEYIAPEMENDPWATENRRDEPPAKMFTPPMDGFINELVKPSIGKLLMENTKWKLNTKSPPDWKE
jgi:hypothetical protein